MDSPSPKLVQISELPSIANCIDTTNKLSQHLQAHQALSEQSSQEIKRLEKEIADLKPQIPQKPTHLTILKGSNAYLGSNSESYVILDQDFEMKLENFDGLVATIPRKFDIGGKQVIIPNPICLFGKANAKSFDGKIEIDASILCHKPNCRTKQLGCTQTLYFQRHLEVRLQPGIYGDLILSEPTIAVI